MCVGAPMRVVSVDGLSAVCVAEGRRERLSLALVGPVSVGDHVLAFMGSAVRTLDAQEAAQIGDALKAVAAAADGQPFEHLIADLAAREPQLPEHLRAEAHPTPNTTPKKEKPDDAPAA